MAARVTGGTTNMAQSNVLLSQPRTVSKPRDIFFQIASFKSRKAEASLIAYRTISRIHHRASMFQ